MSHLPAGVVASSSEENATADVSSSAAAPAPKSRSCTICRSRKVRCDKQSPCSNCRQADIECVYPSFDRPPRWARRFNRHESAAASTASAASQNDVPGVSKVMERVRNLENLVKELRYQLDHAHAAASLADSGSSGSDLMSTQNRDIHHQVDSSPAASTSAVQEQFGRLVLQDAHRSRYVSSGFWSRVNDELAGLKIDTCSLAVDGPDSSDDETSTGKSPSTQEFERIPSERYAFFFRHNLSPPAHDLRQFHPLPSQIPFLLTVYSENVNFVCQIVHMPTISKMIRRSRDSDMAQLSPANEALMFSIYYAAITSMGEDDVLTDFGSSRSDLNLKYRLGLEHALAKADFLNAPDMTIVQAITIFLALVRLYDRPRFAWMMTGLVIRMAQYLGLQRDGSHFEHLTPFEIETRRKVWWALCMLDIRTSEDQGTDLTIASGSFDTRIPLNINDADIDPDMENMPPERDGITDMSFARINASSCETMRRLMAPDLKNDVAGVEEKSRLVNEIYEKFEEGYLKYTAHSGSIIYWVGATIARLTMAKMTLIVFLPVLFSSPGEHFSNELKTKLLVSGIEVAECNHALNAEPACRQWHWIYRTYTHWHSIVYLMIEMSRRPWSPIVERAWVALHSPWLIPARASKGSNLRMWVPLRKLMAKARKHRDNELSRLRSDPQSAARLEIEDRKIPVPSSPGPLSTEDAVEVFHARWRELVALPDRSEEPAGSSTSPLSTTHQTATSQPVHSISDASCNATSAISAQKHLSTSGQQNLASTASSGGSEATLPTNDPSGVGEAENIREASHAATASATLNEWKSSHNRMLGTGGVPWLWADSGDPSIDVFSNLDMSTGPSPTSGEFNFNTEVDVDGEMEIDWYEWVDSVKGMEWEAQP